MVEVKTSVRESTVVNTLRNSCIRQAVIKTVVDAFIWLDSGLLFYKIIVKLSYILGRWIISKIMRA